MQAPGQPLAAAGGDSRAAWPLAVRDTGRREGRGAELRFWGGARCGMSSKYFQDLKNKCLCERRYFW